MKQFRHAFITVVISLALADIDVLAQEMQDVVYLKNGSIIRGMVVEQVPGKSIKVKTADGSVFVYAMDEVERIAKEEVPHAVTSSSGDYYAPDRSVLSINPMGFIVGGVSWIGYEHYIAPNLTYQIRGDIWTYSTKEDDGGYHYSEDETGFGFGISGRAYTLGGQPYSGLFGGFGLDAVFTSWKWEERYTSFSNLNTGSGSSFTLVINAQVGFAIAISNVRIEPSLVTGYFVIKQEKGGIVGVFVAPGLQIGVTL